MLEQIFALGADQARSKFVVMCQMFFGRIETPPARRCQEEKKEEETVKRNKKKAEPVSSWCHQCQEGSVKALQRVVWSLIFLVFGVHIVNAEEQGIQVWQMSEKELEFTKSRTTPDGGGCEPFELDEWSLDEKAFWKERTPGLLKKNSQGKDPRTSEGSSQEKDPRTFQGRCHKEERWRTQEKKEGRWKKRRKNREMCKKSARTRWWSNIGKSFVGAFTRKEKKKRSAKAK